MATRRWSRDTSVGPADLPPLRFIYVGMHTLDQGYRRTHENGGGKTQLAIRSRSGTGEVTVNSPEGPRVLCLKAGAVVLSNDNDLLEIRSLGRWEICWFDFITESPEVLPWHRVMHAKLTAREHVDLQVMSRAVHADQIWRRREAGSLFLSLLARWIAEDGQGPAAEDPALQIEQALRFVRSNLSRVVSVEEMAQAAGLTLSLFRKRFRQVMGLTPKQHYDRVRLEAAMQMIIDGSSVKETAQRLGFSDPFHLTRAYRRMFNSTPRQLKKYLRAGKSAEDPPKSG